MTEQQHASCTLALLCSSTERPAAFDDAARTCSLVPDTRFMAAIRRLTTTASGSSVVQSMVKVSKLASSSDTSEAATLSPLARSARASSKLCSSSRGEPSCACQHNDSLHIRGCSGSAALPACMLLCMSLLSWWRSALSADLVAQQDPEAVGAAAQDTPPKHGPVGSATAGAVARLVSMAHASGRGCRGPVPTGLL